MSGSTVTALQGAFIILGRREKKYWNVVFKANYWLRPALNCLMVFLYASISAYLSFPTVQVRVFQQEIVDQNFSSHIKWFKGI